MRAENADPSQAEIARYRREAQTVQELNLGWLKPLHIVIPELAVMEGCGSKESEMPIR